VTALARLVRNAAEPLLGAPRDYDALLERVGDARFVLLGEATHGTHEFYRERAQISKRLIAECGFNGVAVEADWPDAYRVNLFVRGSSKNDKESIEALSGFKRFPQWMWRNADVLDFVGWLREHNDQQPSETQKCGVYGLDLYSLHASIDAVLAYLQKVDPEAARRAHQRYSCFDHFGRSTENYGWLTGLGMAPTCQEEVVDELIALRRKAMDYLQRDGQVAADAFFCAEQNALIVRNAEQYYRTMFQREHSSWNQRDTHMMDSLVALGEHLGKQRTPAKIIVWAHNSHLGDARATEMHERGELNLGQLVRQRLGNQTLLIGFTTHGGTVTAASDWDRPAERKTVRPGMAGSYEKLFHETGHARFWLDFKKHPKVAKLLREKALERAIGVIYRPETERGSHYFNARLSEQFDAVLHFDHTRAVEPLERSTRWHEGEVEETFPSGI
jgi:erythromycin esterase-like protein